MNDPLTVSFIDHVRKFEFEKKKHKVRCGANVGQFKRKSDVPGPLRYVGMVNRTRTLALAPKENQETRQ